MALAHLGLRAQKIVDQAAVLMPIERGAETSQRKRVPEPEGKGACGSQPDCVPKRQYRNGLEIRSTEAHQKRYGGVEAAYKRRPAERGVEGWHAASNCHKQLEPSVSQAPPHLDVG